MTSRAIATMILTAGTLAAIGLSDQADPARAAEVVTIPVWPGDVPGEKGDIGPEQLQPPRGDKPVQRLTNVTRPTLTVYQPAPDKRTGTAVVICPGGGYSILAMDLEGTEIAAWLNSIGVTGIVLKYRVPKRKDLPKHQAPLQDAQRAMSLVRSNAAQWKIDPGRIGILGFSAGGHLSACAATNFDRRTYEPRDEVDQVSCRPDFAVLIYPAYLVEKHQLAPEIRVSAQTPPSFFVHAADDRISCTNSLRMAAAMKDLGVQVEVHVYADGGHGFGMRPTPSPSCTWPKRCEEWLAVRSLLPGKKKP